MPENTEDLLAQRTRRRIFSWLAEQRLPASAETLAEAFDLAIHGYFRVEARTFGRRQSCEPVAFAPLAVCDRAC